MASISREKNGWRTIQFVGPDKKRRSIRLGKVSQRVAEAVKVKFERLNAAAIAGHAPDDETTRWLAGLEQVLADKLAKGLMPRRENVALKAFLDEYIAGRHDVKPSTIDLYDRVRKNLVDYFGADKGLRDINEGDADAWRLYLIKLPLRDNTVRRRYGRAKHFFTAAMRRRLITHNPFVGLKSSVQANTTRLYFITLDEAHKVIDAYPGAEWRSIFSLSRFGGLRCPSEHLSLLWDYVDWEHNRLTIRSPKTEHHPGGEYRVISLFPELRCHLEDVFEQAEPGTKYVITRYRSTNANLRTQLNRIIRRAGLKPWAKPFQNLRSTRETELAEDYPLHVVCGWLGNTQLVAAKHYLQITDEHFERAAKGAAAPCRNLMQQAARSEKSPGKPGHFACQCNRLRCHTRWQSSPGRTRTYDPAVNSRLLYQLSYRGSKTWIVVYQLDPGKSALSLSAPKPASEYGFIVLQVG